MIESIHNKLERVRKPRVHIKYEVETNDGVAQHELPFVVGVMGDFSMDNTQNRKPLRERKFIEIDRDNFDNVMQRMNPQLSIRVKNVFTTAEQELPVTLSFASLDDFSPENLTDAIPMLKKLKALRHMLRDLLSQSDRSPQLEALLEQALKEPEVLAKLSAELSNQPNYTAESV